MFKRIFIILVVFSFISLIFVPNTITNEINKYENNEEGFSLRKLFAAPPLIIIEYEPQEENVMPNSEVFEIPLEVSCTLSGPFRKWQTRWLRDRPIEIELSILEKPEWCYANITNPTIDVVVDDTEPSKTGITLTITEKAPAFQQGTIKIRATNKELSGIFFTRVPKTEYDYDISFEIGYWPMLNYSTNNTEMEIPPLNETYIPIKIKNLGNGVTKVLIEIEEVPEKWNVTYPTSVTLASAISGQGNETEINIKVKPPKDFSTRTINVSLTSHYLGNPEIEGQTGNLQIVLKNDGSLKGEGFDITLLIIIIVVIFLLVIVSIFLKQKYFSK
jgi:hypothetical protein